MDEDELRAALRTTMTMTPPPPMESAGALAAGHRAVRRRTALAGAGLTAVLVAGIGLAVAAAPHPGPSPVAGVAPPSVAPAPADTKPTWPLDGDGEPQEDATARSGKHYDQAVKLLSLVTRAVPAGWSTPTGATDSGLPLRDHQAQVEGEGWSYFASAAVTRQNRTGRLMVEVHTPGTAIPDINPCSLADTFWNMHGDCQIVTVGPARVGVVVHAWGDERIDQWAAYRYPDGTVVYAAQSRNAANASSNRPPLTDLPLTVPQLAALATDAGFHLT